jgi:hypothetical protein
MARGFGAVPEGQTTASRLHHGFVDACLHELGWGLNPEPLVAAHLAWAGWWNWYRGGARRCCYTGGSRGWLKSGDSA